MNNPKSKSELEISVLVVEDESLTRTLISSLLTNAGFRVVGTAPNASEAMAIFRLHRPQVVLMDIDLGAGPTGLDIALALRKISPRVGLVFITSFTDVRTIAPNLPPMPPASLLVNKAEITQIEQLIEVVRKAYEAIQSGTDSAKPPVATEGAPFTDLQLELMRLISLGKSNSAIAAARVTTVKSTENAISRLAKKLNIPSDDLNNQRVLIAREFFRFSGSAKIHE
jgi:DNA-binding NarL/FixJ family response regulator